MFSISPWVNIEVLIYTNLLIFRFWTDGFSNYAIFLMYATSVALVLKLVINSSLYFYYYFTRGLFVVLDLKKKTSFELYWTFLAYVHSYFITVHAVFFHFIHFFGVYFAILCQISWHGCLICYFPLFSLF